MAKPPPDPSNDDTFGIQLHRLQRSERLLSELYRPPAKRPQRPVRWVRTLLVISLITVSVAVSVVYYMINSFITLREETLSRSANLDAALQRRSNLLANLVKLTLNHAALEHAVFSHTAEMRTELARNGQLPEAIVEALIREGSKSTAVPTAPSPGSDKPDDPGHANWPDILKTLSGDKGLEGMMGRLLAMAEQYPNIQSSETYKQLMTALVEMEDRITERRIEFNSALRQYNTAVTSFPWRYLAMAGNFRRIEYNQATASAMTATEITPELFQQLVPLVRTMGDRK
ncbi:LemA family protein [Rhodovastum atsumiense]|uniref:LemA family protein n=1 Tax=Rhodovastum atsumiense TaxID=504468 RepID=A0A5M6IIC9_9PROT|nr:LemA family protein [Rhodovastum atsumiense]KAA5608021.1 LemA family protein [Rhodovastum atsumiense]CAH2598664.1 LemA family protein [Rhodovastum atsumiense]